jgi:hypothetical protein
VAVISKSRAADEAASDRATYDVATSWRAPDIGIFIEQLPFPEFHKQPGQVPTVLAIDTTGLFQRSLLTRVVRLRTKPSVTA